MEFRWFSIQVTFNSQKEADGYHSKMQRQLEEMADSKDKGFAVEFAVSSGNSIHVYMTRKIEG